MIIVVRPRLLIINCPSEYFKYIPMGSFGLCDYLSRRTIDAKLLNLAVYEEERAADVLTRYLKAFHPTHVGLIFHWQETSEGFLWAGEQIRAHDKKLKILAGGFTAGYLGENLLQRCDFLDYVVKGDPEKPLELLLNNAGPVKIPNLVYRTPSGIRANPVSFHADQKMLSDISFSDLSALFEYERYLHAINKKLGFPLFIGRGCSHTCQYCGGSRSSFRSHSGRAKPVSRSIDSVIADLKRLKGYTQKIYLCYENDRDYVKSLFQAMKKEEDLVKVFQLHYGAWKLPDEEFLELYRDLFIFPKVNKSVLELSPEVFDDTARKKIKHPEVNSSIKDLKQNLFLINNQFGENMNVSVFFSRYHAAAKTYSDMKKEIAGIFRLKHELFCEKISNTQIFYDHLSTDVAGRYWERHVRQPHEFDTLVSVLRKLKAQEQYSFRFDNLCAYIPDTLSETDIFRCELLIFMLKILEQNLHELFHIMMKCMGEHVFDLMEKIVGDDYSNSPGNIFASVDQAELVDHVMQKIQEDETLSARIPFIEDLAGFSIAKAKAKRSPQVIESRYQVIRPKLNPVYIATHDHDYPDLIGFLKRLDLEGAGNLRPEKTVFLFLCDEIISMTNDTYNATIREFEKGISVGEYHKRMKNQRIFTPSYHAQLIAKLFRNHVLY
jgi:hypothetical protein